MQVAQRNMPTQANENAIIPATECEAWRNSRDIGWELGLSQPRVLEILHDAELLPHHYSRSADLFPDGCNSADNYINTLRVSSFYLKFCGQTKHFSHVRVSPLETKGIILMLFANVGIKSVSGSIARDTVVGPSLLPDKFTSRQCRDFFGNCSTGAAWRCASSLEVEIVISGWPSSSAL
jgi:hypothetical protein